MFFRRIRHCIGHRIRRRHLAIVALVLLLCPISAATGAAPATRPAAITQHDYFRATLRFNQRTLREAYDQVGRRDPKWDAPARAFLDAMALYFTGGGVHPRYARPRRPTLTEARNLGQAALDQGCEDPMVGYCFAMLLADGGEQRRAREMLDPLVQELFDSKYSPLRAANAALKKYLWMDKARQPAEADAAWQKFADAAQAAILNFDYQDLDRRIVCGQVRAGLDAAPVGQQRWFYESLAANEKADPWIVNVIGGHYHVQAAWAARGGGWAQSVTEEGWQQFFAHLEKARDCCAKAWELRPDYPEGAAQMITVAMGGGDRLNEDERKWFDRAVAAQLDHSPAYSAYRTSLRPRWGGSHARMIDYARECASTGRFDTGVPHEFIQVMLDIADDLDFQPAFWNAPGTYETAKQVCEGYAKAETSPERADWYRTYHAAAAWRTGRWADACALLDALGDRAPTQPFDHMGVFPRVAMSHAYAMNAPSIAEASQAAERLAQRSRHADAAKAYGEIASKLPADHKARRFISGRAQELAWQAKFEAGEWVDLTPGKDLAGWYPAQADWHVDDEARLVGTRRDGFLCICQAGFLGDRYELELSVDLGRNANGGVKVMYATDGSYYGVNLRRAERTAELMWNGYSLVQARVDVKPVNQMRVVVNGRDVSAVVNGAEVVKDHPMDRLTRDMRRYVTVSGWQNADGNIIKFGRIRVRKLPTGAADGQPQPPAVE